MKKALVLASVASMIDQFNMPNIKLLIDMGYHVDVACNFVQGSTCSKEKINSLIGELDGLGVGHYQIDFSRNIGKVGDHVTAYKQVKSILKENQYEFVHCHSPIGGAVARLAGKATKTKIIYTAHGFHFYQGAPLKNWLVYYPVEWLCSHWTDTLITINQEDYALAKKHMHAKQVVYTPGVGIDLAKFGGIAVDKAKKRKELGVPENAMLLISVGELNENKNHEMVIKAINGMDVYYIIAGAGDKKGRLQALIDEQNMADRIKLLGFRTDVKDLYAVSDVFVFPSFREGLSVSLMEAMACGKPCAVSAIRGNLDLIDENGGEFFDPGDVKSIRSSIEKIACRDFKKLGNYNTAKIKGFDLTPVIEHLENIYAGNVSLGGGGGKPLLDRYRVRNEFHIKASDYVLIYIGELNHNKNQTSLLDMMHVLLQRRQDVKLMLVGKGNMEQTLRDKCQTLGVSENVIFTGYRGDADALLAAADIAVPSSIREGLGLNVLEAMASGLPVVAYDNRGHRSIIEDSVNGIIVNNGDHQQMADAVLRIIESGDERQRIACAGRERVQFFGIDNVLEMMKKIYGLQ